MSERFDGETAIVTGSSKGIGKEIATAFAREGANVVTNSRSDDRAAAAAAEIREDVEGASILAVECDVTEPESVSALVDATVEEFGALDVMVNNAGMTIVDPAEEQSPESWQRVIDVDLSGVFYGSQAAGQQMIERGTGGAVVNVSSMMGRMGLGGRAPSAVRRNQASTTSPVLSPSSGPNTTSTSTPWPRATSTRRSPTSRWSRPGTQWTKFGTAHHWNGSARPRRWPSVRFSSPRETTS